MSNLFFSESDGLMMKLACDDDVILFGDLSRVLGDLAAELLAPADVDVEQRRHLVLLRQQVRRNCRSYRYQLG